MRQSERQAGIRWYAPTWREVRWWVLVGTTYGVLSVLVFTVWPATREALRELSPWLALFLVILSPAGWALILLSLAWPGSPGLREALIPALLLSAVLGGLAGYVLRIILKILIKR